MLEYVVDDLRLLGDEERKDILDKSSFSAVVHKAALLLDESQ